MDLSYSTKDLEFRDEVRDFIRDSYPAALRKRTSAGKQTSKEDVLLWHEILYKKGWVAPSWPVEYGGTGWSLTQRYIFNEELGAADTLLLMPFGLKMLGPVLMAFGNQNQKDRFLPPILSGKHWWAQGYSEPGSGSDLASLRMRAVRDGDEYVVNGTKTWTSYVHFANWIFCLVRTNTEVKKQQGISFLLIDMSSPGITTRPIVTMDGIWEIGEVFFDDVRVPVENLVGEENAGWTYAKYLLTHERSNVQVARTKSSLRALRAIASNEKSGGRPLTEDDAFARKLAKIEVDLTALEFTELRSLADEVAGRPGSGAEASILKLRQSEIQQAISELELEATGYGGLRFRRGPFGGEDDALTRSADHEFSAASTFLNYRKTTIYGGSSEIQKSIVAKAVLGL